jgi:hypothetical protein
MKRPSRSPLVACAVVALVLVALGSDLTASASASAATTPAAAQKVLEEAIATHAKSVRDADERMEALRKGFAGEVPTKAEEEALASIVAERSVAAHRMEEAKREADRLEEKLRSVRTAALWNPMLAAVAEQQVLKDMGFS